MGPNMTSRQRLATPGSSLSILLAALVAGLLSSTASADDAVPANTLRVGMYFVKYNASAANLSGPFTPPGINLRVDHVNTPYFAYLRRLSAAWELELAAGVPPTTHTRGVGPATLGSVPFNGQEVATAKWFSPTVLLEYKFLEESSAFRPYVGGGVNYTHFYERNSTAAGDAANGGPTRTYLSDSVGPAATVGISYKFTKHCNAIASYSVAQVNSHYNSVTSGISRTTDVHFNPGTWVAAVGYSF
jgi:outer membrane protein